MDKQSVFSLIFRGAICTGLQNFLKKAPRTEDDSRAADVLLTFCP